MRLTQETLIPLGLTATVVLGVGAVCWRISASYASIETRLDTTDAKLTQIEKKLNDGAASSVSERDLRLWMMMLKDKNPSITIPDWVGR